MSLVDYLQGNGDEPVDPPLSPAEREAEKVRQASNAHDSAWTPQPLVDDYGTVRADTILRSLGNLDGPRPTQIEWLFLRSDEWGRTVARIGTEVWRRGIQIVPRHDKYCRECGSGTDDPGAACPTCSVDPEDVPYDLFRDPDEDQRQRLRDFLDEATVRDHLSAREVGARWTEELLKHGRGYIVYEHTFELEADGPLQGRIVRSQLQEIHTAASARMVKLQETSASDDYPGTAWICLACRTRDDYSPQEEPGRCDQCANVLYEAPYAEVRSPASQDPVRYWTRMEVHETRWPYKDGSPPVARLWPKASALLLMDWYAAWALDPKRDKRPDKVLVTIGGDKASIKEWAEEDAERRKKNPYALSHLHVPTPPGGMQELGGDVQVVSLGEKEFKGQMVELRREFESGLRKQYHLSPLQGGSTEGAGGLNNEGQQLRSTAQVAEDIHHHGEQWLNRIPDKLNVTEWRVAYPPAIEEDEGRQLDVTIKHLNAAERALKMGAEVRWEDGEARIMDGPLDEPAPDQPPGGPGGDGVGDGGGQMFGTGAGLDQARAVDAWRYPPVARPDLLRQAVDADTDLPGELDDVFGGPAGSAAADDALFSDFADLDAETTEAVHEQIIESLTQPQGWSTESVVDRVQPVLENAGVENAEARAQNIARMEARSIASEWQQRIWEQQEAERDQAFRYTVVGADDFRTTKMSRWIRQGIPDDGMVMTALEERLDRAIDLAKQGAFTENGRHSDVPGQPIQLPDDFERRGFVTHFGDRDVVQRVVT